jgi:aminoglycoside phosphotransferase family enzyme
MIEQKVTTCSIEGQIASKATRVIYTHSNVSGTLQALCLKIWQPWKDKLYDTEDIKKCTEYLLEGWEVNQRFAQNVYLGLAPVLDLSEHIIRCGPLIEVPEKSNLAENVQYVLVMKRLDDDWQLSRQLQPARLGTEEGMEFLAKEAARMHKELVESPLNMGTSESIYKKLRLNLTLFDEALRSLVRRHVLIDKYRCISNILIKVWKGLAQRFQERHDGRYTKRCHGDLKATNLWVRPGEDDLAQHLLATDCIDFNPEFCHIDTLSDIAMLAADIEMHLRHFLKERLAKKLTWHFLETYLLLVQEDMVLTRPLLEYYITEKSVVCAFMSILYDDNIALSKRYLDVAYTHMLELTKLLYSSNAKRPFYSSSYSR